MEHLSDSSSNNDNVNKCKRKSGIEEGRSWSRKRVKTVVDRTVLVGAKHLDVPLRCRTAGSVSGSIRLKPDRPYSIGRSIRRCDFVFDDRRISRQHCQILYDAVLRKLYLIDGVVYSDIDSRLLVHEFRKRLSYYEHSIRHRSVKQQLYSTFRASLNGVFVNGVRIGKGMAVELSSGDVVTLMCANRHSCTPSIRIGFVVQEIAIQEKSTECNMEGSQFELYEMLAMSPSSQNSQGPLSSRGGCKKVFASKVNSFLLSESKCEHLITRANCLLNQCAKILLSNDPVSCIQGLAIPGSIHSSSKGFNDILVRDRLQVESVVPCERVKCLQFGREVGLERNNDLENLYLRGECLRLCDDAAVPSGSDIVNNNLGRSSFDSMGKGFPPVSDCVENKMKIRGSVGLPPGKNFYLNRLRFMHDRASSDDTAVSLPELLYPVESILQIFIATFTSDILWFLSSCEIPNSLPITLVCHNSERCWSSKPEDRTSVPYSDFPNLVVVYPQFPEAIAFGNDLKKRGIACHHPKLFVLQREDSLRVIITSANLVEKQWIDVTNTVWWQDFPRRNYPDYSSLFTQICDAQMNQDSVRDFASQLAGFMASLLDDVPSQVHWVVELTKYEFGEAMGYLVTSIPGLHSCRSLQMKVASGSSEFKYIGSLEGSVVGLSHFNAADSDGTQLKKVATFLKKPLGNTDGYVEIALVRNKNVPADANAVSIHVHNPSVSSMGEDVVQLGFLPRKLAKWVSPLWDIGVFKFSAYVRPELVLGAVSGGNNKKVPLSMFVSQGPNFKDISKIMQPEHVIAFCCLIKSIQRCTGIWRLHEVLGRYKWPESLESDFVYSASSIGSSINAQFLATFSAAAGKTSLQFDSQESDPEWGCWNASHELRNPSIKIVFPTIERVKNAFDSIFPSKRILCFSEKTWERLRTTSILHDAIPHPHDREGHPMHIKVASRQFQSRTGTSSSGWVYCGSHNFSAAAWGRQISNSSGAAVDEPGKADPSLNHRLHICNYELGIIFIFPPSNTEARCSKSSSSLDDIVLPFVVPSPKYGPRDRPATSKAMREALDEVNVRENLLEVEEIPGEEDEPGEATASVAEDEEDKTYAENLWSQIDSSNS